MPRVAVSLCLSLSLSLLAHFVVLSHGVVRNLQRVLGLQLYGRDDRESALRRALRDSQPSCLSFLTA